MGDSRDFFRELRQRLDKAPNRHFDRNFWSRFDDEFGESPSLAGAWIRNVATLPFSLKLGGATAALALTLFLVLFSPALRHPPAPNRPVVERAAEPNQEVLADVEMLQELDLFMEGHDIADWETISQLNDQDFEALIKG